MSDANMALESFQRRLLAQTIQNALKTPFYRERWTTNATPLVLAELASLPTCDRMDVQRAGRAARVVDGQIAHELFTSGSSGTPLAYAVGEREQHALASYWRAFFGERRSRPLSRAIRFLDQSALLERQIPVPVRFHNFSIWKRQSFDFAVERMLDTQHCEDNVESACTILSGSERVLRAFTESARVRFANGFPGALRYVFSFGSLLTSAARREYEEFWRIKVVDRYGLSEVVGGASEDELGWYLFDPFLVPEVIGVSSRQPIREGVGMLVLTALFPFQEAQPLVRYWTGDVVRVTHTVSSFPGRLAIRPLGRAALGFAAVDRDEWLLTPDVIYSVLEPRLDIERAPLFIECSQVVSHDRAGLPKCRLVVGQGSLKTTVTLLIAIRASEPQRQQILDDVRREIVLGAPDLDSACRTGKCEFQVVHSEDPEGRRAAKHDVASSRGQA